jgi:hypothetical protein
MHQHEILMALFRRSPCRGAAPGAKRTFAKHRRLLSAIDMPIAPRKYRARHMHIIVNHGTVGARNEGATRA